MDKFYTIWCKCLKQLFDMPLKSHSKYIPLIVKDIPVEYQLYLRLSKFLWRYNPSNNTSIQLCNTLKRNSNICKSFTFMPYEFNLDRVCMSPRQFQKVIEGSYEQMYDEFDCVTISVINDLLLMRQFN